MADEEIQDDNIQHGIDDNPRGDTEKGAVIGAIGGAIVGGLAGGPPGAVIGANHSVIVPPCPSTATFWSEKMISALFSFVPLNRLA